MPTKLHQSLDATHVSCLFNLVSVSCVQINASAV